jgi:hypothetical protein
MPLSEFERIAYHEAGHAVAACLMGERFSCLHVPAERKTLFTRSLSQKDFWSSIVPGTYHTVARRLIVCCAGLVAETFLEREARAETEAMGGDTEDIRSVTELLSKPLLGGQPPLREAFPDAEKRLLTTTGLLLRYSWEGVEVLARELLNRLYPKSIGYGDAKRIVEGATSERGRRLARVIRTSPIVKGHRKTELGRWLDEAIEELD